MQKRKGGEVANEDEEGLDSIDEDFEEAFAGLRKSACDLLVNVGIISSLRPRWPIEAQRNWQRELENMTERMDDDIRTAQEFASSFD